MVRGVAINSDSLPIIGINDEDRAPAKSFSLIHELVHIIKRTSSVCNEMYNLFSTVQEEVFCNAVAGEVLVPGVALKTVFREYSRAELSLETIAKIAKKFSVSKEVIILRRLYDITPRIISKVEYEAYAEEIRSNILREKEEAKIARAEGRAIPIPQNPSRDAVDRNSANLNRALLIGYGDGVFSKQDISRYVEIKQQFVDKYLREVSTWNR